MFFVGTGAGSEWDIVGNGLVLVLFVPTQMVYGQCLIMYQRIIMVDSKTTGRS